MKSALLFAVIVIVSLALFGPALTQDAQASMASCSVTPGSGLPGTTFVLSASGFSPNTQVFAYAVDPSGAAFADPTNGGFGGGARTNSSGSVTIPFPTTFVESATGTMIARALGTWTVVIDETAPGNVIKNEARCTFGITGGSPGVSGLLLTVTPEVGYNDSDFTVIGTGLAPFEQVNAWLNPPLNCDAFAFELQGVISFGQAASAFSIPGAKADANGNFALKIFASTPFFCVGQWSVVVRSPTSGLGGTATFQVIGHPAYPASSAVLVASPASVLASGGQISFLGSGYLPSEPVLCFYTRPEGNVREFPAFKANGSGSFDFSFVTGFDYIDPETDMHYSEGSVGTYTMSCEGMTSHRVAKAEFLVYGLPFVDP